jgi:hypothetical protein
MTRRDSSFALAIVGAIVLWCPIRSAAARSFVASYGVDTNPCSLSQPWRSFDAAIQQTPAGGEIVALDSAGYGAFTVDRSISITAAPGVFAGVSVTTTGAQIVASNPIVVRLRGLDFAGSAPPSAGTTGVTDLAGSSIADVYVERCTFRGLETGIDLQPPGGLVDSLIVLDSTFVDNAPGIHMEGLSINGTTQLTVSGSRFVNGDGIYASQSVRASIEHSVFSQTGVGIRLVGYSPFVAPLGAVDANIADVDIFGAQTSMQFEGIQGSTHALVNLTRVRSSAIHNDVVAYGALTVVYVSDSTLTGGGVSAQSGAQILSRGNNTLSNTLAPFTGQFPAY